MQSVNKMTSQGYQCEIPVEVDLSAVVGDHIQVRLRARVCVCVCVCVCALVSVDAFVSVDAVVAWRRYLLAAGRHFTWVASLLTMAAYAPYAGADVVGQGNAVGHAVAACGQHHAVHVGRVAVGQQLQRARSQQQVVPGYRRHDRLCRHRKAGIAISCA